MAAAAATSGLLSFLGLLSAVLLRDFWAAPRLEKRREERGRQRAALAVYTSYADPLATAATSVFWRLYETFYQAGRSAYLRLPEPATAFQSYKRESTVYRLAALLGWIRAFRRELSFFTLDDKTRLRGIEEAVNALEVALAEGRAVEARRAAALTKLWNLDTTPTGQNPPTPEQRAEAAVRMEEAVKTRHGLDELWRLTERTHEEQLQIVSTAADSLYRGLGYGADNPQTAPVAHSVLEQTLVRAIQILAAREAWLFRDQQAALGDVMLQENSVPDARRRFEVKSYAEIDAALRDDRREDEEAQDTGMSDSLAEVPAERRILRRWLRLVERILSGLDVEVGDPAQGGEDVDPPHDARVRQLRQTLVATARLLVAISEVKERPGSVSDPTVRCAKGVLRDHGTDAGSNEPTR